MHAVIRPGTRVERPAYALLAIPMELFTAIGAIPVGITFLADPSGASMGLPHGWIEGTVFGSYLVPGLYLLLINGIAMLVLAALTVVRHWTAPWLTALLGAGLTIWILVQVLVLPEVSPLQALFLVIGLGLVAIGVAWLSATRQLVLRGR